MKPPSIVVVCTGNAARSVMGELLLKRAGVPADISSAGTLVVEGQPLGMRTRDALVNAGLPVPSHRSRQLTDDILAEADLVVAMAAEHVNYVRVRHLGGSSRIATLSWLCENLPTATRDGDLARTVESLDLGALELDAQGSVPDPAGGDFETYRACLSEVILLCGRLAPLLGAPPRS